MNHPTLAELVERTEEPSIRAHLSACAPCRARSRLLAVDEAALAEDDPGGFAAARAAMAEIRHRASNSLMRSLSERPSPPGEDLQPGRVFDRYVVESWIGRGGMGSVYRVRHRDLGSQHALKVLHGSSEAVRERLRREGRAQGRLRHPNVVQVTDVIDVDGAPGLILELIEGPTLAMLLREQAPLAPEQIDRLAVGIVRGVAAAHQAGLIHRDLKPSNVLLARSADGLLPKVADFGLALQLDHEPDARITQSHTPLGTPAYMAPEQIRDASRADVRSDVFSLGTVLYELVTGRRAFEGRSVVDVYERIRTGQIAPVQALAPSAPARWRQTIARALSPDPADRFPDCDALLSAWQGQAPPQPAPRRWAWPLAAGLAAAAVAGLALGIPRLAPLPATAEPTAPRPDRRLTARGNDLQIYGVALSPDGTEVTYTDSRGVWRQGTDAGTPTAVLEPGPFHEVDYFPDGQRLMVSGTLGGFDGVWSVRTDGSDPVLLREGIEEMVRLSPDGRHLAVADQSGLWIQGTDGDGHKTRLRPLGGADATAALVWSPSGRTIAAVHRSGEGAWIELTTIDGRSTRRLLSHPGLISLSLAAIAWLPPDRLVYGLLERGETPITRLYALDGAETATDVDAAVEIRQWQGFNVIYLRTSADGRRAVHSRIHGQRVPYLLSLEQPRTEPRRLNNEEWDESPLGWSRDGDVWLGSARGGGGLFRQPLDGPPAARLNADWPVDRVDPVGDELVYLAYTKDGPTKGIALVRAREGWREEVIRFPLDNTPKADRKTTMRCRARCLLGSADNEKLSFSWVDLESGGRDPLSLTVPLDSPTVTWDLAPDGQHIAILTSSPGRIVVHDLSAPPGSPGTPWPLDMIEPTYVAWGPDGDRLYVAGLTRAADTYRVLEVRPDGSAEVLWSSMSWYLYNPSPSPDGRHLALSAVTFDDDLWLTEGLAP